MAGDIIYPHALESPAAGDLNRLYIPLQKIHVPTFRYTWNEDPLIIILHRDTMQQATFLKLHHMMGQSNHHHKPPVFISLRFPTYRSKPQLASKTLKQNTYKLAAPAG